MAEWNNGTLHAKPTVTGTQNWFKEFITAINTTNEQITITTNNAQLVRDNICKKLSKNNRELVYISGNNVVIPGDGPMKEFKETFAQEIIAVNSKQTLTI